MILKPSELILILIKGKDKCEGHRSWTDCGYEYDFGYSNTDILCENCIFAEHGYMDPRKKYKGFYNKIITSILNHFFPRNIIKT